MAAIETTPGTGSIPAPAAAGAPRLRPEESRVIWLLLAALVAARFIRFRRSWLELAYAIAFVAFGLSDFKEAYRLESWLLLFKGINLIALLWLRHLVIRNWYPTSKIY